MNTGTDYLNTISAAMQPAQMKSVVQMGPLNSKSADLLVV